MDWRTHPHVQAFVQAGFVFCRLVESESALRDPWLPAMLAGTAALYASGLALPHGAVEESSSDIPDEFAVTPEQWTAICERLSTLLKQDRWYLAANPKIKPPEQLTEAVYGDLADDLADIYRDIAPGLRWRQTDAQTDLAMVVWQWKFDFTTHWEQHAVTALGVLHHLVTMGPV